jgi:hypothetical protein
MADPASVPDFTVSRDGGIFNNGERQDRGAPSWRLALKLRKWPGDMRFYVSMT